MIRVFAKKTFEFVNTEGVAVKTAPLTFTELPDWVVKTPLFILAKSAGEIEVFVGEQETKKKEKELG